MVETELPIPKERYAKSKKQSAKAHFPSQAFLISCVVWLSFMLNDELLINF